MSTAKIAVKNALTNSSDKNHLLTITKDTDLINNIFNECIGKWNLEVPVGQEITEEYALRFDDDDRILTTENMYKVKDATILKLVPSVKRNVLNILESLGTHGNAGADVLLQSLQVQDKSFLHYLVDENEGIDVILKRLMYDLDTHDDSKMINYLLEALCLIMVQAPHILGEKIEPKSEKLVQILAKSLTKWSHDSARIHHTSVFLTVIQKSLNLCHLVKEHVQMEQLITGLILNKELPPTARVSSLALLNEIILNAEERSPLIQLVVNQHKIPRILAKDFLPKRNHDLLTGKQLYYVQCWSLLR